MSSESIELLKVLFNLTQAEATKSKGGFGENEYHSL